MNSQVRQTEQVCTIRIEGELTIYTAAEHKGQLFEHLHDCEALELDLSEVAEMDSAGLQILLMLKREADHADCRLRLTNHSQAVFEVLELLNMQSHFGDPVVIPADWKSP